MLTFLSHFISIFQQDEEEEKDEEVELSCNGLDTIAGCNHIHAFARKWIKFLISRSEEVEDSICFLLIKANISIQNVEEKSK